ncbi:MAG: hypothetical protein D6750_04350 [Bacteroidetes bacterium]|nr:MAG: hypothetical protein D6750_04350 [Bacteroidota bacterium]
MDLAAPAGLIWRVPAVSPRLRYVLEVLFGQWLRVPYRIVPAAEWPSFSVPTGWRIVSYGTPHWGTADLTVPYSGFVEAEGTAFCLPPWDEGGFFPGEGDFRWDLPAMAFYVLTLYPLYEWPYGYDRWGLYAWHRAPFYQAPFWQQPFLLVRAFELLARLGWRWPKPPFHWEIGWDIDHLFAFRGRGGLRWWLGGLRRRDLLYRLQVRLGRLPDPYDTLEALIATFPPQHSRFFFLLSQRHRLDSLVSPHHPALQAAIHRLHERGYPVGIHPSYESRDAPHLIQQEKALLEKYLGQPVTFSRQHYLRYRWPDLLVHLEQAGLREDYTLAFPERSGFLLGTTLPVPAYRVDREQEVAVTLWGPALMDQVYLRPGDRTGLHAEMRRLFKVVEETGGVLHFIWHNSTYAELPQDLFAERLS